VTCPPHLGAGKACLRVTVILRRSPCDRARKGHAAAHAHRTDRGQAGVRVPGAGASRSGDQAAAAASPAPLLAVHDRSCASGFPPGGLHPIGADHCPERERSRAWSEGLPRCFGRAEAPGARGLCACGGARPKDLGTLDGSRGGLILPRRVKAGPPTPAVGPRGWTTGSAAARLATPETQVGAPPQREPRLNLFRERRDGPPSLRGMRRDHADRIAWPLNRGE
jgi:hypothetical protein